MDNATFGCFDFHITLYFDIYQNYLGSDARIYYQFARLDV